MNSTTNHTPGPWTIEETGQGFPEIVSGKYHIALSGGSVRFSTSEAMANARLIAAAPDLLDALWHIAAWLSDPNMNNENIRHFRGLAERAIKKAEGVQ